MPKALTDYERILAFAFRATTEELVDAIAVLKAAHSAKAGGKTAPKAVNTPRRTRSSPAPPAGTPETSE